MSHARGIAISPPHDRSPDQRTSRWYVLGDIILSHMPRTKQTSHISGPDCAEGSRTEDQLVAQRRDQTIDNRDYSYLDEEYHASRVYKLSDIDVPVLSVANLGGIMLHLRGNVVGYLEAGTPNKWLYFISGR